MNFVPCACIVYSFYLNSRRGGESGGEKATGLACWLKQPCSKAQALEFIIYASSRTSVVLRAHLTSPPLLMTGFTSILSLRDLGHRWAKGGRAICPRRSRPGVSSGVTVGVMLSSACVQRERLQSWVCRRPSGHREGRAADR